MDLDSVRRLKAGLLGSVVRSGPFPVGSIALGISGAGPQSYRLAVRVQDPNIRGSAELDDIVRQANGEADVAFVGTVQCGNSDFGYGPKPVGRVRPLVIGCSVGQSFNAGTLGCFVRRRVDGKIGLLSTTHVLGADDEPTPGAAITQPSRLFGGRSPADLVASLADFVELKVDVPNLLDCAVAVLAGGITTDPATMDNLGNLSVLNGSVVPGMRVAKLGHGTNATEGRVTAIEIDNLVTDTMTGSLRFDGQVEIMANKGPFASLDDCGTLVVDEDRHAVGLLFAVTRSGATPGEIVYANPIDRVLNALNIDLVTTAAA
jgi:hypothetical protein